MTEPDIETLLVSALNTVLGGHMPSAEVLEEIEHLEVSRFGDFLANYSASQQVFTRAYEPTPEEPLPEPLGRVPLASDKAIRAAGFLPEALHILGRRAVFLSAARSGRLEVASPIDGAQLTSTTTLYINHHHLAHVFCAKGEVFLLHSGNGHEVYPAGFFFPARKVIIQTDRPFNKVCTDAPRGVLLHFRRHLQALMRYCASPSKRQLALYVFHPHLGHHLWNDLAGLEEVGDLEHVARVYVLNSTNTEHFGRIEELFPTLQGKVHRLEGLPDNAFIRGMYSRDEFILRYSTVHIPASLASKVLALSSAAERDFQGRLEGLKRQHDFAVLVNARFENRSWINMEEELVHAARSLADAGLRGLYVFDGHNSRPDGLQYTSHGETGGDDVFTSRERQFAERFRHATRELATTLDNVGGSVGRSLIAANTCDFFIAPWGAALAKYKWVANARGIVASNPDMLRSATAHLYDTPGFRDEAIADAFFGADDVSPAADDAKQLAMSGNSRGNFRTVSGRLLELMQRELSRLGLHAGILKPE